MTKNDITAAELMQQLQKDPAYVAREAAREEQQQKSVAEFEQAERPIVDELKALGVAVDSLSTAEGLSELMPFEPKVVEVFLRWIPKVSLANLKEALVRYLAAAGQPFDGQVLVDLFEQTDSPNLRWAIASTLAEGQSRGVTEWVIDAIGKPQYGQAREMLVSAVARLAPDRAKAVLTRVTDEFPQHVSRAFAEMEGADELESSEPQPETEDDFRDQIEDIAQQRDVDAVDAVMQTEDLTSADTGNRPIGNNTAQESRLARRAKHRQERLDQIQATHQKRMDQMKAMRPRRPDVDI